MLKLEKITKVYHVADMNVDALKGVTINFRKNEFVSVLGPSGCGKTTLLNIIGGLDRYTTGDLLINGRSTKEYKDRDWDVYRNHRIGFIFQSYNLIPHQTVLGNVELALTIAGIDRATRVQKAKEALDKVGLSDQYYKRPNQLSGGQCQRVAIARSLVNDPEILLADEPTGALDTATSKQIMDIIKEISKDRLVIMVTHNPEIAEEYSTRIITLRDGLMTSDNNPFKIEPQTGPVIKEEMTKKEKAKMSFWTAFRLSLQNLFSKKGRTTMTSIAGSIGIIGVSLVLSMSYGVQNFINNMQDDMLSGNPILVRETALDISSLISQSSSQDIIRAAKEHGFVNINSMIDYLISRSDSLENMFKSNNITEEYINYLLDMPKEDVAMIDLNYGLDVTNSIFTDFSLNEQNTSDIISLSAIKSIYTSVLSKTEYSQYSTYIAGLDDAFAQAPTNNEYILSQYNILDGHIAQGKNEVMIVLDEHSELTDLLLAQLGYYTQDQFMNMVYKSTKDSKYNPALIKEKFSYSELMGKSFTWYPNDSLFVKNNDPVTSQFSPYSYNAYAKNIASIGSEELQVVGILEPKETISYGCLTTGFYYTADFAKYVIDENIDSEITQFLHDAGDTYVSYKIINNSIPTYTGIIYTYNYTYDTRQYTDVGLVGQTNTLSALLGTITGSTSQTNSTFLYSLTSQHVGGKELPNTISIYAKDFEHKKNVLTYLDEWNSENDLEVRGQVLTAEERDDITYTDALSLIISIINNFINVITIALIGFTALSLVVSCVMIGIITYVSVVERTKEIGVIRSLGGRKNDVSALFNAETFIIGLASGLIGVGVTYVLSGLINLIVWRFAKVASIAIFPINYALIMISISILLTLISGFLPSRAAARKDPVVALRTE